MKKGKKSSPSNAPVNINAVEIGSKTSKKASPPPLPSKSTMIPQEKIKSIPKKNASPPQKDTKKVKKEEPKQEPIKEKNEDFKEKRLKRIAQSKLEEEKNKKIYDKIVQEYKDKKSSPEKLNTNRNKNTDKNTNSTKNSNSNNTSVNKNNLFTEQELPKINISEEKVTEILKENGILDAYQSLVIELCKNGLPLGSLFEYSADYVQSYEKKWKSKKSKACKKEVENYWKEKKKELDNYEKEKSNGDNNNINTISTEEDIKMKLLDKNLKERELNVFIKSLDKSRSTIGKKEITPKMKQKEEELKINNKDKNKSKITVTQSNENSDTNNDSISINKSLISKSINPTSNNVTLANKTSNTKLNTLKSKSPNTKKKK